MTFASRMAPSTPTQEPWRHRHILDVNDFSREEFEMVFRTADAMHEVLSREIPRVPALRGRTVVTLFYEPSTRTRVSFEIAAKALGADVINMTASASSVAKGESLVDTVRTLQALGADLIVLRHSEAGAPYLAARSVTCSVINAGDGWHAHPTQALLDCYTVLQRKGSLQGLRVVIVGDILHSRVARSDAWAFTALGADVTFCGPPPLLPTGWRPTEAPAGLPPVHLEESLERALEGADVVMPLRLQLERHEGGLPMSLHDYIRLYQINSAALARAKRDVLLLHPGPMNEGVEIAADVARGGHSVIEAQVSHGVAIRMALLYLLLAGETGL